MPQFHMSTSELNALKPNDTVYIDCIDYTVSKVGRKWIELKNTRNIIDIALARVKYTGYGSSDTARIFRTRAEHAEHSKYHARLGNLRKIVGRTSFSHEVLFEMEPILVKHGLIEKEPV